jgi:hypothetical protein
MARLACVLLVLAAGCGNITRKGEDAGIRDDAAVHDAPADAPVDAEVVEASREGRELVGGGAKLTGATYTFEVQVGHGISQIKVMGATHTLEGNAAVKP